MAASTTLLQFLLMVVAGWLHRQQAAIIDYLKAENRKPRVPQKTENRRTTALPYATDKRGILSRRIRISTGVKTGKVRQN